MRILLLEDDILIGDGLKTGLNQLGFAVDWFKDGETGYQALATAPYDAVVLDLGLPGMDGMQVLAKWRHKNNEIPVLVLTARDALDNRVAGLEAGADDYLCKPFALSEVAARLKALIRRSHGQHSPLLMHGQVKFDPASHCVTLNEQSLVMTARELALLELFMRNKGRILPKALIEEKLYSWDDDIDSNTIEVYIHHLRRKLGNSFIRTVRGVGYTLGDTD